MLNVGIVASGRAAPKLVKLTDRQISWWLDGENYLADMGVDGAGRLSYISNGVWVYVPGEWLIPPGVASAFSVRVSVQAGANVYFPLPGGLDTWMPLSASRSWRWFNAGGRVLVEIRDNATQTVQASARFWTPGFAP